MQIPYPVIQNFFAIVLGLTVPYIIKFIIWLFNRYSKFTEKREEYAEKLSKDKSFSGSFVATISRLYLEKYAFFNLLGIKDSTPISRKFIEKALIKELINEDEAKEVHDALIFFKGKFVCVHAYWAYIAIFYMLVLSVVIVPLFFMFVTHNQITIPMKRGYEVFLIFMFFMALWILMRDLRLLGVAKKIKPLQELKLNKKALFKLFFSFRPAIKASDFNIKKK